MLQETQGETCSICVGAVEDTSIVGISGEIDIATVSLLAKALGDAMKSVRGDLILDTQELTYIDSAGIQTLVSTQRHLESMGRKMVIAGCHGIFRRLMKISQFDTQFIMYTTVEEAIEDLNPGREETGSQA